MKKVYIVTDGAYSDYGICGVFDDEALAAQFQELFAPRGQVEAWDLNPYEREIRAGEGVFGLRRAFHLAGAKTVIMSLWPVEDQTTRQWMSALYENRFTRNLSSADAVRQASLAVLRLRRTKGVSTHPFYWAAFVAAGDWR